MTLYGVVEDFASWYVDEHPRVLSLLCAVSGDPETARDATDEAFARCYSRWDDVRNMESPAGWTYRVALNVARRTLRRRAVERRLLPRLAAPHPSPEPPFDEVAALLHVLTERQRTAICLRYVTDLAEADIARVMGVRRGTVASTLSDARRRLAGAIRSDSQQEAITDA